MSKPSISPQFDSDERAQLVLREALQGNFVIRDYKPDFFLDYHIERRVNGEPSGETVFIQLKGQENLRATDGVGKVQVKAKALRYYATSVQEPVFIVLVDGANRKGYYLFAQKWLDEQGSSVGLSGDKRITVNIPLGNELANIPKFLADVQAARCAMREKYPGSPEAALAKYAAPFAALDPRLSVQAFFTPSGKMLGISANQPTEVRFDVLSSSPDALRQFVSAAAYGKPINLSDVRLKAHGSPLFEKLLDGSTPVKIQWGPTAVANCSLDLSCEEPAYRFSLSLPMQLTRGVHGIAYETVASDCPLGLSGTIEAPPYKAEGRQGSMCLNPDAWTGTPLLMLPWYKGVTGFVRATNEQKNIRVALTFKGQELFVSELSPSWPRNAELDIVRWFEWVTVVRTVAEAISSNVPLPKPSAVSDAENREIIEAHHLLTTGTLRAEALTFSIAKSGNESFWPDVVSGIRMNGESMGAFKMATPHRFHFFGREASLGELRLEGFEARITAADGTDVSSESRVTVKVAAAKGGDIVFRLYRACENRGV